MSLFKKTLGMEGRTVPHSFWPRKVIKSWSGITARGGEIDLVALHNGEMVLV